MSRASSTFKMQALLRDYILDGEIDCNDELSMLMQGGFNYYSNRRILTLSSAKIQSVNDLSLVVTSIAEMQIQQRSGLVGLVPIDEVGIQRFQKEYQKDKFPSKVVLYSGAYTIRASMKSGGLFEGGVYFVPARDARVEYRTQGSKNNAIGSEWMLINTEEIQGCHAE